MNILIMRDRGSILWGLWINDEWVMSSFDFNKVSGRAISAIAADGEDRATVNVQVIDNEKFHNQLIGMA